MQPDKPRRPYDGRSEGSNYEDIRKPKSKAQQIIDKVMNPRKDTK